MVQEKHIHFQNEKIKLAKSTLEKAIKIGKNLKEKLLGSTSRCI